MPPKTTKSTKDSNSGSSNTSKEPILGENPLELLQTYQKYSKLIGIPVNQCIVRALSNTEQYPVEQIIVDEELGNLGAGGTRALCHSIMTPPRYKLLKSMRFWRVNVEDEGVNAISELLRLGGSDVKLSYLELLDNNLTYRSGMSLGAALSIGNNLSLLTLKLDYNRNFGDLGVHHLSIGLRTNSTLKQLHLQFCGLTNVAGKNIADILANTKSHLDTLNLNGNKLGGRGLYDLCSGLALNSFLTSLHLADNNIDQNHEDLEGLNAFRDCLLLPTSNLTSIDLMYNRIGAIGGQLLIPALAPERKKIKEFLVDLTIPDSLFEQLFRKGTGGGKKGKKGGKKKSKK